MKKIFVIIICSLSLVSWAQKKEIEIEKVSNIKTESFQVLAKFIQNQGGDKVHTIKYKILKNLSKNEIGETIDVGFYNYKLYEKEQDTVLLTIENYTLQKIKDYFIFPDYDAKKGIEKARVDYVDSEYWENCETGVECNPLNFSRKSKNEKWFLILPCGGTFTDIALTKSGEKNPIKKLEIEHSKCPPYFELTEFKDGKYFANMIACGLGGKIEFNIITTTE
jgi:hypothetical protein